MKLSIKFFCIAYIVVLLTTSISGIWLISSSKNSLKDTKVQQTTTAVKYAADSFASFAETTTEKITKNQINSLERQIDNLLGNSVSDIKILTADEAKIGYSNIVNNEGFIRFIKKDNATFLEAVHRIDKLDNSYYTVILSDFSGIEEHYNKLWQIYGMMTFFFAIVSGILLYVFAKKITNPIYKLSNAAEYIADGNYGNKIDIKSRDIEIAELSKSFNHMSLMINEKINEIENELYKRDMFVSNFTHEIKTPMTAIIGYSQMLSSYNLNKKESAQAINTINKESTRLEKLAMQLLDLYIYDNEKIKLVRLNLKSIEQQVLSTLKPLSQKHSVKININFNDIFVFADEVLLFSLIYNLADNAIKASSKDNSVEIYSVLSDKTVKIFVKDNGRGISPENIRYLTEPFYREDKARSRALGGAGLGLSLCEKIAVLHGTTLVFESEINKGTTVSFDLKTEVSDDE